MAEPTLYVPPAPPPPQYTPTPAPQVNVGLPIPAPITAKATYTATPPTPTEIKPVGLLSAATYNADLGKAQSSLTGQGYTAQSGTAKGYDPTKWSVDNPQTVSGQLSGLLSKGSPLLDQAQARSNMQMNQRGLLNSSMAIGAGQAALYQAALPIATADAQTYAQAGNFNANASNAANQFNTAATNQQTLANQQFENQSREYGATATNQANAANQAAYNQQVLANQQASNQAGQFNAGAQNTLKGQAAEIDARSALANADAANKFKAQGFEYNQQQAMFDLNATQQSLMQTAQFQQDKAMYGEQKAQQLLMQTNEYQQAIKTQAAQFAQQTLMQTAEFQQQEAQFGRDAALKQLMQSSEFAQQKGMFELDTAFKTSIANADANNKLTLQTLSDNTKKDLASVEAAYKTILSSKEQAGTMYAKVMQNITDIVNNPDFGTEVDPVTKLTPKEAAIKIQKDMLTTALDVVSLDIDSILDFLPDRSIAPVDPGADGRYGFTGPGPNDIVTHAVETWRNKKTGQQVTFNTGGYQPPSADWVPV